MEYYHRHRYIDTSNEVKDLKIEKDLIMLSDMQRNVQTQIKSATNKETKLRLKIYRNRIMTKIHRERKQEENVKVRTFIQPLINQNQNQRMYEAVKNINKMRPKQLVVIKSDEGLVKRKQKSLPNTSMTYFGKMAS